MTGTENLRKENQALRKEIQDLKNQQQKITDDMLSGYYFYFINLYTVNFPQLALILISYCASIVPPQIAFLAPGNAASVLILSVY